MAQYHLVSMLNGKVADIEGGNGSPGTRVIVWPAKGVSAQNQNWKFEPVGHGYFMIVSALNPNLVLDVEGGHARDGVNIVVWNKKYPAEPNQMWKYEANSIISALPGHFAIDCQRGSDGDALILWNHHGDKNQQFYQFFSM